ncbi:hypothetical protein E3N88_24890 [Mikania micrantha]|uniref:Uncharacterized protein n=1 Tax=Mikania micrantha TaxID=192012 RepID=A0A5N6N438_9ASTR|nr:hypothetical protein E3N88_24890 [Mikania micrantha]
MVVARRRPEEVRSFAGRDEHVRRMGVAGDTGRRKRAVNRAADDCYGVLGGGGRERAQRSIRKEVRLATGRIPSFVAAIGLVTANAVAAIDLAVDGDGGEEAV